MNKLFLFAFIFSLSLTALSATTEVQSSKCGDSAQYTVTIKKADSKVLVCGGNKDCDQTNLLEYNLKKLILTPDSGSELTTDFVAIETLKEFVKKDDNDVSASKGSLLVATKKWTLDVSIKCSSGKVDIEILGADDSATFKKVELSVDIGVFKVVDAKDYADGITHEENKVVFALQPKGTIKGTATGIKFESEFSAAKLSGYSAKATFTPKEDESKPPPPPPGPPGPGPEGDDEDEGTDATTEDATKSARAALKTCPILVGIVGMNAMMN